MHTRCLALVDLDKATLSVSTQNGPCFSPAWYTQDSGKWQISGAFFQQGLYTNAVLYSKGRVHINFGEHKEGEAPYRVSLTQPACTK